MVDPHKVEIDWDEIINLDGRHRDHFRKINLLDQMIGQSTPHTQKSKDKNLGFQKPVEHQKRGIVLCECSSSIGGIAP